MADLPPLSEQGHPFSIDLGDAELHGEARGDAPRLLLLHGFGGDRHGWDAVWERTAASLPAIRSDLRGFGQSRMVRQALFNHADDVLAILDHLAIEQADIAGMSLGGGVALNFALDHPERVRRLILVSPLIMAWDWTPHWRALWRQMRQKALDGDMDGARALWAKHPLFATVPDGPPRDRLDAEIARFPGTQWIKDWQQDLMPDVERLPGLAPPTLLLTGARDMEDFRVMAAIIEASAPQVTRIDLADCGHMLTLEAPDLLADTISDFLR